MHEALVTGISAILLIFSLGLCIAVIILLLVILYDWKNT